MSGRSPARQRLATAQTALAAAREGVSHAEAAVAACSELASQALAARDQQAERARQETAAGAAAIRDAVKAGKAAPAPPAGKARAALFQAESEVASRREALQLLESELGEAKQAEAAAWRAVRSAIEGVLLAEAEAALAEGERAVAALNTARRKLIGINALATNWQTEHMPAARTNALLLAIEPVAAFATQAVALHDQWGALAGALASDPDAAAPDGTQPPAAAMVLSVGGALVRKGSPQDPTTRLDEEAA